MICKGELKPRKPRTGLESDMASTRTALAKARRLRPAVPRERAYHGVLVHPDAPKSQGASPGPPKG